jgi:hypothetical protein
MTKLELIIGFHKTPKRRGPGSEKERLNARGFMF